MLRYFCKKIKENIELTLNGAASFCHRHRGKIIFVWVINILYLFLGSTFGGYPAILFTALTIPCLCCTTTGFFLSQAHRENAQVSRVDPFELFDVNYILAMQRRRELDAAQPSGLERKQQEQLFMQVMQANSLPPPLRISPSSSRVSSLVTPTFAPHSYVDVQAATDLERNSTFPNVSTALFPDMPHFAFQYSDSSEREVRQSLEVSPSNSNVPRPVPLPLPNSISLSVTPIVYSVPHSLPPNPPIVFSRPSEPIQFALSLSPDPSLPQIQNETQPAIESQKKLECDG